MATKKTVKQETATKEVPKRTLMVDEGEIKAWIDILENSTLAELEIEVKGTRIRLAKGMSGAMVPAPVVAQTPAPLAAPVTETPATEPTGTPVKAPMVGTFYASPDPDSPSFVKVGDTITKGQVLCIIEAMKIMNEIESEQTGTVTEILVKDSEPLEYNQPMFMLK